MNQRFVEKEALLKYFYKHGEFPENVLSPGEIRKIDKVLKPTVIGVSYRYILFISLVCFVIAYAQYRIISTVYSVLSLFTVFGPW